MKCLSDYRTLFSWGIVTSQLWYDLAEQILGSSDSIERSYRCLFDDKNGYLCLGRKRMVFVEVRGIIHKDYDVLLDVPYDDLKELVLASRFKIDFADRSGSHKFETVDYTVKAILDGIEEISKK